MNTKIPVIKEQSDAVKIKDAREKCLIEIEWITDTVEQVGPWWKKWWTEIEPSTTKFILLPFV